MRCPVNSLMVVFPLHILNMRWQHCVLINLRSFRISVAVQNEVRKRDVLTKNIFVTNSDQKIFSLVRSQKSENATHPI
jgi:hypothetical protein